ncbi:MAG: outer membrane beta-barrel protein, partial [Flavobacteriales bacterium]|nr:outer membrane beta-barrel protein [Flavobacteriales bacterium]
FRAFEKFKITALLTNGWQIITETPANTNKALGLQLEFDPTDKIHINYSNIYSNEAPDSAAVWIFYQNLYGIFDIHKRFRITAGVDIGLGDNTANNVQSTVALGTLIARYKISEKWAFAARGEVYSDPKGLIIVSPTPNTFEVFCYSGNLDFAPNNNLLFRVEGRAFTADNPVFREDRDNPQAPAFNKFVNQAMAVTFAMQVKID